MNNTIEFIGAITRYLFSLLKKDSKQLNYFYDPFWKNKTDINERLKINGDNRKIGFLVLFIFIILIYVGFFDLIL